MSRPDRIYGFPTAAQRVVANLDFEVPQAIALYFPPEAQAISLGDVLPRAKKIVCKESRLTCWWGSNDGKATLLGISG